jgi:hypothetical protein
LHFEHWNSNPSWRVSNKSSGSFDILRQTGHSIFIMHVPKHHPLWLDWFQNPIFGLPFGRIPF